VDTELEAELKKLIAERDIRRQLFGYQEAINRADYQALAKFFGDAKIATVASGNSDELHGVINGGHQFAEGFRVSTHLYNGDPRVQYGASNVVVDVNDSLDTATCRAYFFIFQALDDYDYESRRIQGTFPLQAIGCGRYIDTYKYEHGEWQIVERKIYSDLSGDYSGHMRLSPREMAETEGFFNQEEGSRLKPTVVDGGARRVED
jgi:SnoaL-like domain